MWLVDKILDWLVPEETKECDCEEHGYDICGCIRTDSEIENYKRFLALVDEQNLRFRDECCCRRDAAEGDFDEENLPIG